MSSTRHAETGAPLSQERYMSSPEYAELRGISGTAVTAKAGLLGYPAKRSLLFFLQAMSLQPGGLQEFTRGFLGTFPDRIGTPSKIAVDCRERLSALLPGFIIELCINPQLRFSAPGETDAAKEKDRVALDQWLASVPYWRGDHPRYTRASLDDFHDIVGALFEYKRRYEESSRRDFVMTEVGRHIFEVLDLSLATGKMVVVQGESRIGKTTATEAWANQHLGEARFVSLNGVRNYSGVFRAIAKALGLASSYAHSTTKVQAKIEDMLQRSRLVLLLDEAHFLLSAAERTRTAPELIDWVNTALYNHRVPCALICTPQLTLRMARHEHQAGWNADQWRGRVKRFCVLPEVPKAQDLRAVARKLLPEADKPTVDYIVGYALSSKLHMSAVVDVVDEAKMLAQREGRGAITFSDVERAVLDYCAPSAAAMVGAFTHIAEQVKGRGKRAQAAQGIRPVERTAPSCSASQCSRESSPRIPGRQPEAELVSVED